MKTCTICKIEKEFAFFYKSGLTFDGKQKYKGKCKDCYDNDLIKKRQRLRNLVMLELGYYSCKLCGYSKTPRALHLHHLDASTKEFQISNMWSKTDEEIRKEASKCVILCANCHAEVHEGIASL